MPRFEASRHTYMYNAQHSPDGRFTTTPTVQDAKPKAILACMGPYATRLNLTTIQVRNALLAVHPRLSRSPSMARGIPRYSPPVFVGSRQPLLETSPPCTAHA